MTALKLGLLTPILCMIALPSFALCVQNSFANLRSGPGLEHKKTWKVLRYMPLEKLSKKDGWYQVKDLDGRSHWIREDLVTTAYRCAVIKNEFAYLRQGPGTSYPKKSPERGEKYLSFRLLKLQKDWARLEDSEGDVVWIYKPLLWIQ